MCHDSDYLTDASRDRRANDTRATGDSSRLHLFEAREVILRRLLNSKHTRHVEPSNGGKLSYRLPLSLATGCLPPGWLYIYN